MTRHLYHCPLRWADLDQLGHVNNVTYVDYLQEARVDMLRVHPPASGGEALAEGVVVVRHEVQYRLPLVFRLAPVSIEIWVTEVRAATFTLAYEVFDETPEGRRVYLQARSVLSPYVFATEHPRRLTAEERDVLGRFLQPDVEPLPPAIRQEEVPIENRHTYDCAIRFSDVDAYRHVNNVKYFEFYQEARIALLGSFEDADRLHVLVAQTDVDYRRPMFFREQPYQVDTWVSRVGTSSFVFSSLIRDGDEVLSRAQVVMVAFDPATERPVPLTEQHRRRLTR
ncbi:MAG TPA: thioesterase family protein [Marmoricola sp.]|nr:thioesterase family protein [Marmoricola sp.]